MHFVGCPVRDCRCSHRVFAFKASVSGKRLLDAVLDIPIVLPPLVVGLSLLILFQFRPFAFIARDVIYQVPAVVLAQFSVACAFAVRTMKSTFDHINPRCEQVAVSLGSSRERQAFGWVVLPEATPGIMTAFTLAWARSLGEFGPLLIFAGATRMKTEVLSTTVFLANECREYRRCRCGFNDHGGICSGSVSHYEALRAGCRHLKTGISSMIQLDRICVRAGDFCLNDVSLSISSITACGVLMGRTGSGKTTILECILGLRRIASGRIQIGDTDVTSLNPAVRGIGYVPQDAASFSRMTVRNIWHLRLRSDTLIRNRLPTGLMNCPSCWGFHISCPAAAGSSGGEAQRVALGLALLFKPQVLSPPNLLFVLDSHTRDEMCDLLDNVRRQTHVTTLHVTHNLTEATRLSDCLFRIEDGKVLRTSLNDL